MRISESESAELIRRAKAGDASLLKHTLVATAVNSDDKTPLHFLADVGCAKIIEHPMAGTIRDRFKGMTPIHLLAKSCDISDVATVAALLAHPSVATAYNMDDKTPLHILAERGCDDIVEHPKANGPKDKSAMTPLVTLASTGNERGVDLLRRIEPNNPWCRKWSNEPERKSISEDQIKHLAAKREDGRTILHDLAEDGDDSVLDHPEVATAKDYEGNTPLHYLALAGVPTVLEEPRAATVKNKYGETPLEWLAEHGNLEAKSLLATKNSKKDVERER